MAGEYAYLKEKIEAGGDYIITQLFYDADLFIKFVERCRADGITCPILPGMLPMVSHAGLARMVQLCKIRVPAEVVAKTDALKEDEAAFKAYGVELCAEMCKKLVAAGSKHLHFYTLNLEHSTCEVLKLLNLFKQ
jgi:methylenetetrahydrofolate reductase (NADPH)